MNINEISLPKWPQMIVTGKPVTMEQAKDIIFKTDSFLTDSSPYAGGNNREFNRMYRSLSGLDKLDAIDDWGLRYDITDKMKESIGYVETEYVNNSWASCAFIFGPHGWCHPSGKIEYSDNVGKWPSANEIVDDWTKIAEAFPYLDINVTLMSGEGSEDDTQPVFNIRVVDGRAEACEPDLDVHKNFGTRNINEAVLNLAMGGREQGLPFQWVEEFAATVRSKLDNVEEFKVT